MNFTEFIKKVDKAAGNMPAENMAAFLHDYARSVPEYKREAFLERLFSFIDQSLEKDYARKQDAYDQENLKKEIEKTLRQLEDIDSGEMEEAFRSVCNEVNYLRLILECQDYRRYQKEAEEIYMKFFSKSAPEDAAKCVKII